MNKRILVEFCISCTMLILDKLKIDWHEIFYSTRSMLLSSQDEQIGPLEIQMQFQENVTIEDVIKKVISSKFL